MTTRKLTTEQFKEKAIAVHGDEYDYTDTIYKNTRSPVTIRCRKHGLFSQPAKNHLFAGSGCQLCSGSGSRNTQQFITLAKDIHGDIYDYSLTEYVDSKSRVKIGCPVHGYFDQIPHIHLNKSIRHGCPDCGQAGRNIPHEVLIERFKTTHGDRYGYDKIESGYARDKVTVSCKKHGDFRVTAHNHEYGTGCPSCAFGGFRVTQPGTFYVLKDENPVETTVKVGITGRDVDRRVDEINWASGKHFKVVSTIDLEDGNEVVRLERQVLAYLKETYKPTQSVYDGSTESFVDVDLPKLLQTISAIMTEKT